MCTDRNIENLLSITNLAKSKKTDSTKFKKSGLNRSKKSDLIKYKKSALPKASIVKIYFETNFQIFKDKKAFIYLQKIFNKAIIFIHFDLEHHIYIKTDVLAYAIGEISSQMNLD